MKVATRHRLAGGVAVIFLLLLASVRLHAQKIPDNIYFEHIPVPGVIHSVLTEDITRDEYGMMWMAKDVLYRYDGSEFRKYDFVANDSSFFKAHETNVLYWDTVRHRLLIGTRNFGVVQYSYESDKLERLPEKHGRPIINDIARTRDGVLLTSMTSGVFSLRNDTLVKVDLPPDIRWPSQIVAGKYAVWVACEDQVIAMREHKVIDRIRFKDIAALPGTTVRPTCITFDNRGHLWIGTERNGIVVVDTARRDVVRRFPPGQRPFHNRIIQIAQDTENLVWIATNGDGLVVYNPADEQLRQLQSNDRSSGSLTGDQCTSIFVDPSGIVWIGAAGDINKFDRLQIKFSHYSHNPYNTNSLADDNIRNIYFDGDRFIYSCTSSGYINLIDRTTDRIERLNPTLPNLNSFITPLCITRYDKDNLLVATTQGLLRHHVASKSFRYFEPLEQVTRGSHMRQIIKHDNTFHMLLGGSVLSFNPDTKDVTIYGEKENITYGSALAVDSRQRLWVGVRDGVAYLDPGQEKFNVIPITQDVRPDSTFFLVLSLEQIGDQMWVNSFNNGIYIIDLSKELPLITERLTTASGLGDNTVYATIPDRQGNIWITHNSGLTRYHPGSRTFVHFAVSEGLQGEEFNRLAFSTSPHGDIAIGGTNGINVFDPEKVVMPTTPERVRLVDITALSLTSNEDNPQHFSLLDGTSAIQVSNNFNSLRFSFLVADYHVPPRHTILYKFDPFDKDWIQTDKLTTPLYPNLLPGVYEFTVKMITYNGNETIAHVSVEITPPYWRTWWFLGLAAIACSFLVYSVIYSRIQTTKRETKRLEELLKSRTREIEQSREELENLNRKKDLIFSILSHDLRSPLTTLKGFLGLIIDQSDALTKEELQKYATNIRNSVTTSLDLIDNTLFWSLSQTGNIHCHPTQVPIGVVFDKIRDLYHLTAEKKRITVNFGSVNGLAVYADENMVYVLLRNLVSNAIKFTPEMNSIIVDAVRQGALVSIRIKDHGVGMTQQEIDNIFTLDNPIVKKGTSSEKGTGLGLLLCKKFVELNHGKLLIESKPGEGSSFTVLLPSA